MVTEEEPCWSKKKPFDKQDSIKTKEHPGGFLSPGESQAATMVVSMLSHGLNSEDLGYRVAQQLRKPIEVDDFPGSPHWVREFSPL